MGERLRPLEEPKLHYFVELGIRESLNHIRQNYDEGTDLRSILPYHNSQHTLQVVNWTETILRSMANVSDKVTGRDIELGRLAAGFHDWQVAWRAVESNGMIKRECLVGDNERASANAARSYIQKINGQEKKMKKKEEKIEDFFKPHDMQVVTEAILATIPRFDPALKTIVQPNLTKESSPVAFAVAMADLGASAMDSKLFQSSGDRLFAEVNIDITENLYYMRALTEEQKESYRQRMLEWHEAQINFVIGRWKVINEHLDTVPRDFKTAVYPLLSGSIDTVDYLMQERVRRHKMSFDELKEYYLPTMKVNAA